MTLPNIASINNYGSGVLVDAVPLVDSSSEMPASALNALRNDAASMTATAPRVIFQYTGSASNPSVQSSSTWTAGIDAVWGNSPSYLPVMTRTGTGAYTVQLPSSVADQIGNTNLVNIRAVRGNLLSGTTAAVIICNITSSSTFTIKQFLCTTGAANDLVGVTVFIEVF